jgi:hypothetical protein
MGLGGTIAGELASGNRARLTAAGYVLDDDLALWLNRALDRAIDAGIAERLTTEQLDEWIAAGRQPL